MPVCALPSVAMVFTCVGCATQFNEQNAHRAHYKSNWHRYNLKRKVAGLVPMPEHVFIQKRDAGACVRVCVWVWVCRVWVWAVAVGVWVCGCVVCVRVRCVCARVVALVPLCPGVPRGACCMLHAACYVQ